MRGDRGSNSEPPQIINEKLLTWKVSGSDIFVNSCRQMNILCNNRTRGADDYPKPGGSHFISFSTTFSVSKPAFKAFILLLPAGLGYRQTSKP